ncbi:MAG: DUF721 domain-containing protein [Candidatus Brocadiia bacterium]
MSRSSHPEKIGDILRDYLHASGLSERLKHLEVYSAWEEVVGPALAPHTRVAGFKDHKLFVEVDSAAHLHELSTFYKGYLLDDLRERLGGKLVRDIVFRPAPLYRS